jgi:uncharacterized RDD family membrane protein YckC
MYEETPPLGFPSHDAKRSLSRWVWGLGVPFGLVQVAIPVASVVWMLVVVVAAAFKSPRLEVDGAVSQGERIWVPRALGSGFSDRPWELAEVSAGAQVVSLPAELSGLSAPLVIVDGDRIVAFGKAHRAVIEGSLVRVEPWTESIRPASRPFSHNGKPAVLDRDDQALRVRAWSEDRWSEPLPIGLEVPESMYPDGMVVVADGQTLHVFLQESSGEIHHAEAGSSDKELARFRRVTTSDDGFAAGLHGGKLHVVRVQQEEDSARIDVLVQAGDGWKSIAQVPASGARDVQWLPWRDQAQVVTQAGLGGVQLIGFDGRSLGEARTVGGEMGRVVAWALLPQGVSLLLAVLYGAAVALLMRSRRTREVPEEAVRHASLGRRGVARGIDTFLMALPPMAVLGWFAFSRGTGDLQSFVGTGAQVGFVAWALLLTLVFSALEGHTGKTPGKVLLGIRVVGTDLRPCGFGRSLARNLLLAVDGFLLYQVGVMMIALSARQQRFGDVVGKTLVIEAGRE